MDVEVAHDWVEKAKIGEGFLKWDRAEGGGRPASHTRYLFYNRERNIQNRLWVRRRPGPWTPLSQKKNGEYWEQLQRCLGSLAGHLGPGTRGGKRHKTSKSRKKVSREVGVLKKANVRREAFRSRGKSERKQMPATQALVLNPGERVCRSQSLARARSRVVEFFQQGFECWRELLVASPGSPCWLGRPNPNPWGYPDTGVLPSNLTRCD